MNIELLAPAGNLEKLKIAIQYGADAVYVAGQRFGLRSAANNFSTREIRQAVEFANTYEKKIYITLNAYLHNDDFEGLPEFIDSLSEAGAHAVICSDMGIVELVRQRSEIPVHISTQASVLNSHHARIWKKKGASRIVVGRELSIDEAGKLKNDAGIEVEMFVHGALCMSYSGHCSLSTYIAGRDSNRGGCIQNCRFKYHLLDDRSNTATAFFMSSKDLNGLSLLPDFMNAGIDSLKIEGRMKSELYVASTVRAYANAIRDIEVGRQDRLSYWQEELTKVPHRDYTTAWLDGNAGADSVYDKNRIAFNDYKLAGIVIQVISEQGRYAFQVKNRMKVGDSFDLMLFNGELKTVTITKLKNIMGNNLDVAQPGTLIWLEDIEGVEAGNVGRVYRPNE